MVELYQDTLVDLLLPKNAKRLKLDIKKDSKVIMLDWLISNLYVDMLEILFDLIFLCLLLREWCLLRM